MKVLPQHYTEIRDAIAAIDRAKVEAHREALKTDSRVKDLDMRLRWDLLHSVKPARWVCDTLYPYANDTHIDTALRAVVKELAL